MDERTLQGFRAIADAMSGPEPRDWQWVGEWESQRHFGITESRAKAYAERHGGVASRMEPAPPIAGIDWSTYAFGGRFGR